MEVNPEVNQGEVNPSGEVNLGQEVNPRRVIETVQDFAEWGAEPGDRDDRLSGCCGYPVRVVGRTTLHHECSGCGEACDAVDPATWDAVSCSACFRIRPRKDLSPDSVCLGGCAPHRRPR